MSVDWRTDDEITARMRSAFRQEAIDFRLEMASIRFWRRRSWILGGTALHVAAWLLITLIGLTLSGLILLKEPEYWYLSWNLITLPGLYTIFNLIRYWQEPYW